MNFQVLFEDNHLIAINKPAGVLSQGDDTGDNTVMEWAKSYIKARYNKPGEVYLGQIHRLDRPVSGVILFARTSKALTRMNDMFKERKITKTYWAITTDQPDPIEGKLQGYIYKDTEKNRSKMLPKADSNRHKGAKMARLSYKLMGRIGANVLLNIKLDTGRSHQIRVQLAEQLKAPIRGDIKYGSRHKNEDSNINLHARSLEFLHPVKKEQVKIIAPVPREDQVWGLFHEMEEW